MAFTSLSIDDALLVRVLPDDVLNNCLPHCCFAWALLVPDFLGEEKTERLKTAAATLFFLFSKLSPLMVALCLTRVT